MKKIFSLILFSLVISYGSYGLSMFTPASGSVCVGSNLYLNDSLDPGGIWTSSNTAIATIGSSSGIMTGMSAGVVTITYTLSSAFVTGTFTVNPGPAAIAGASSVCVSSSITLTNATPGGTWSSGSTYVATVGASTGIVTGAHNGTTAIMYTLPGGCYVSHTVTVGTTPASAILGPGTVCVGSTITLTDSLSIGGGVWSSSNPSIAAIGSSTGIVTGVSVGSVTITYAVTGTCGTVYSTRTITVSSTTSAGTITGPGTLMVSTSITLADAAPGGTWSSGSTGVATVSSGGVVTGVAVGTSTISYAVTGCGGTAYATTVVTVSPFDGISGHVNFSSPLYGAVKVWLIHYNPSTHMLTAVDSAALYCSGTSVFYQFNSIATDSFRVKAAADDTLFTTTGFIPTYHTSDFYWYNANVIYHTSGTSDINKDINMATGTVTSGPGFIAGDVTTGANKGTSGSAPAVGLLMCAVNSVTHQVMQQDYTDATGHYSFNNLPVGATYYVFPTEMGYLTTPYTSISLTASNPSMTAAKFEQHTVSKTITPIMEGVEEVQNSAAISVTPNPASTTVNITWKNLATGNATVVITDMTGKNVLSSKMNITSVSGSKQLNLHELADGVYLFHVMSDNFNYTGKLVIQK